MSGTVRQVILVRHLKGQPTLGDFCIEELPRPTLAEGEVLVRNMAISADPEGQLRALISSRIDASLSPGKHMPSFAVGVVEESCNPKYAVGQMVAHADGWASHAHLSAEAFCYVLPEIDVDPVHWLGALGLPGMMAWFGLKRVGQIRKGDQVLITASGGAAGTLAGQLARLFGAVRVIGLAGSDAKRRWLVEQCGFEEVFDRRMLALEQSLARALPEGADILFDAVGIHMVDRMLPLMRPFGRVIVAGQSTDFQGPAGHARGIRNTNDFITRRLRMEGLVPFDDLADFPAAQIEMADLLKRGQLRTKEVIGDGLDSLPHLFVGLANGSNFGRRIARL